MSDEPSPSRGPDLNQEVALDRLADLGHVGDEPVLLVRRTGDMFAVGATCTHYGAPPADGLLVDNSIRCSWHHACFTLRTDLAFEQKRGL